MSDFLGDEIEVTVFLAKLQIILQLWAWGKLRYREALDDVYELGWDADK